MKNQWLTQMVFDFEAWGDDSEKRFEGLHNLITRRQQQLRGFQINLGKSIFDLYQSNNPDFLKTKNKFMVVEDPFILYNQVVIGYIRRNGMVNYCYIRIINLP